MCQYRAVPSAGFEISTDRLTLRPWRSSDAVDFAEMNADVDVMADLGGPLTRRESDRKLRRFQRFFRHERITRWADPEARVELKGEQRLVTGRAAVGDERERLWDQWRRIDDNLDGYAARRPGETAVVVLEPRE